MGSRDSPEYLEFASLEEDIRLKLKTYIIGFLKLERITWQKSSAELLEKVLLFIHKHKIHCVQHIKRFVIMRLFMQYMIGKILKGIDLFG